MPFEPLTAISSIDGRYRDISAALLEHFSEFGLIRKRLFVECEYLIALGGAGVGMRKLAKPSLADISEWTHFALTSEDVNSIAHALALRTALQSTILPGLDEVRSALLALAKEHAATPMLARTHGQPATPSTFGKEMRVFEARLARQLEQL